MSTHSLPVSIDPFKYADQGRVLEGELPIAEMLNLVDSLLDTSGSVAVKLTFGRDEQNIRFVDGLLKAQVELECQRCLTPVTKQIESEFQLGIVFSDDHAKQLPKGYEPLIVSNESVDLLTLVEEELILSMPMFAYHDECAIEIEHKGQESEQASADEVKRDNPFGVLAELKLKK